MYQKARNCTCWMFPMFPALISYSKQMICLKVPLVRCFSYFRNINTVHFCQQFQPPEKDTKIAAFHMLRNVKWSSCQHINSRTAIIWRTERYGKAIFEWRTLNMRSRSCFILYLLWRNVRLSRWLTAVPCQYIQIKPWWPPKHLLLHRISNFGRDLLKFNHRFSKIVSNENEKLFETRR